MKRMTGLVALALALLAGAADGQNDNTKLDPISYADLGKLVRSHKGKVVVVYVWAHY